MHNLQAVVVEANADKNSTLCHEREALKFSYLKGLDKN